MWVNRAATVAMAAGAVIALIPLVGVIVYTVGKGLSVIDWSFLSTTLRGVGPLDTNGGIYHAIVGTIEQVLIASIIAVPLGILAAV